jgi:hypothetical protein
MMKRLYFCTAVLLCGFGVCTAKNSPQPREIWTKAQAHEWYQQWGWLRGCNFTPSTAVNQLEMWQAGTFDPAAIDRELGWAEDIGMNCMRVFLHHVAWETDKAGFKKRMKQYLDIAGKHHISTIFVIFDDCWNATYAAGKQPAPKPGVHNSGWLQDPGDLLYQDTTLIVGLEAYVKDILTAFKDDKRIVLWDLYNEPGAEGHGSKSLPLLRKVYTWARTVNPSQPLSSGVGLGLFQFADLITFQLENADVITYHAYEHPDAHRQFIDSLKKYERPMICTEYMARKNSTFQTIMPMLKQENIGAINWGLVAGKTNTVFGWNQPMPDVAEPPVWFHDIFRKDGTPYSKDEINFIKRLTQNHSYYMMNTNEVRALPEKDGVAYISSDKKVAVIKGNHIKAVGNGECVIHAVRSGVASKFAQVTVGWQVQNPVLPYAWEMYIPDSEVHNFNGHLYVYGSMDASHSFCSPYYASLTTADVTHWESQGFSFSSYDKGVPYPGRIIWDSDGHYYKGKYFLYGFFEWDSQNVNYTFVLDSDSPMGPFKNFRWVTGDVSGEKIDGISAEVFVDDDDSRYILYAPTLQPVHENYPVIARLVGDNVIDESSRKNLNPYIKDFYEAPSLRKRGDTYYFIYAENCGTITDRNHTPKRLSYATSKEIFGEYTYRGTIITVEDLDGNGNIQGSIEQLNGEWYVFYHRATNGVWNKRALCVEKISFDSDGLIIPVVPTSSGVAEGLNTSLPVWFNTAVFGKNYKFTDEGKYGYTLVNGSAEIGFRYILFTGKEKQLVLQGVGLENITSVKVMAGGKIIGEGKTEITLNDVPAGKAELTLDVVSTGETRLETLRFVK